MLETTQYVRKEFNIDAVQVTSDNIHEVARWVDSEVRRDSQGEYVKVRVHRPMTDRQTKAYVSDWVLYAGTGYKVYTRKAFAQSFKQVTGETNMIDTDALKKGSKNDVVPEDDIVSVVQGNVVVPKRVSKKKVN